MYPISRVVGLAEHATLSEWRARKSNRRVSLALMEVSKHRPKMESA